jgi:hypothetical protein
MGVLRMKFMAKLKAWFKRKKRLRAALYNIRHDPNPKTRPEAVYEYLSIKLEDVTRKRPLTTGEYEILSAMIIGNALAGYPNRKYRIDSFKNIERLARELVKNIEVKNEG